MTQTGITGGLVSVEDCKKHDGYPDPQFAPTRKIRVELSFAVPEDTDAAAFLAGVSLQADNQVKTLLGQKPAAPKELTDKEKLAKEAGVLVEQPKPAAGPRRGSKTNKAAEQAAGANAVEVPLKSDALEDEFAIEPSTDPNMNVADPDDLENIAPATEVTDQQLTDAMQAKNKALKEAGDEGSAVKIRKLVNSYNPDPAKAFTAREIAQKDRTEFLAKLKSLT